MNKLNSVIYKGLEHEVKTIAYGGKATQVIFRDNIFLVYVNNKTPENKVEQEAAQQLKLWMILRAEEQIKQRTKEFCEIIGVDYNHIRIKDTKTRWGSCSSKGNLNFNFRILMAPQAVMDYIIVHELCHLKHMNHGKAFWDTVAHYMPDYEVHKQWLKTNGIRLYVI